ncbi:hypothetical protein NQ317_004705 [Molorchus minor]|uniref:Uncharacterized protein n=1 Tax=Molorchus minor TaxID=1323400 RepID=A0ABQ9J6T9_9CUCU|nr:hypothetical protein NQ317_004705 [Molorchus minor]
MNSESTGIPILIPNIKLVLLTSTSQPQRAHRKSSGFRNHLEYTRYTNTNYHYSFNKPHQYDIQYTLMLVYSREDYYRVDAEMSDLDDYLAIELRKGYTPGGSSKLSVCSGAAVAALAVIGLALALVTGVTADPPLAVALVIADLVASFTSLNLSMNCEQKKCV